MDIIATVNYILTFILFLYGDSNLPRKVVDDVMNFCHEFVSTIFIPSLRDDILTILKNENIPKSTLSEINRCFYRYSTIFANVDTEPKRFHLLKKKGFIDHKYFTIGTSLTETIVDNEVKLVPESIQGIFLPLRETLKLFLQIPGVFRDIMDYIKELSEESNIITNIIQGDLWQTNYFQKFNDDIVLPLYVFFDELEVGNPLGSHKGSNKFSAVYVSIASLPPRLASRLHSILFSTLLHSSDKKLCGNEKTFKLLIEELNFLNKEGILIKVNNVLTRVKFQLVLILGDNLGLNSILGFTESFNSNFYCRVCKASWEECAKMFIENEKKLRTKDSYESDLKLGAEKSGLKEECVFNKVNGFHVMENLTVDLMHDFLEGVCTYIMSALLNTFIFEKKFFTLQTLNLRIQNFNFGPTGNSNKPPAISLNRLLKTVTLKMSAAEMLNFVKYFGLIIGDKVPKNDRHWQLFLYMRRILDILLSPRVVRSDAKVLKQLIEKQNSLYEELYGNLKPKFHFLVHYPRLLLLNGPIINFWGMRFESFHGPIKSTAQSTNCKKNFLKTIATKQTLRMCQTLHSIENENPIKLGAVNHSKEQKLYFKDDNQNASCKYYSQVNIEGAQYNIGSFLILNTKESEVEFGEILDIVFLDNKIYFYVIFYEEVTFDFHFHAYIVKFIGKKILVKHEDLPRIAQALPVCMNKTKYVVTQYGL